jgi:hypothetical protein
MPVVLLVPRVMKSHDRNPLPEKKSIGTAADDGDPREVSQSEVPKLGSRIERCHRSACV